MVDLFYYSSFAKLNTYTDFLALIGFTKIKNELIN